MFREREYGFLLMIKTNLWSKWDYGGFSGDTARQPESCANHTSAPSFFRIGKTGPIPQLTPCGKNRFLKQFLYLLLRGEKKHQPGKWMVSAPQNLQRALSQLRCSQQLTPPPNSWWRSHLGKWALHRCYSLSLTNLSVGSRPNPYLINKIVGRTLVGCRKYGMSCFHEWANTRSRVYYRSHSSALQSSLEPCSATQPPPRPMMDNSCLPSTHTDPTVSTAEASWSGLPRHALQVWH